MFFKNLCVKVLKVNTTSQLFFSIFRAFRHGALLFYHSLLFLHCWVWNRQYSVFPTNWESLKTCFKNLCDKVSKMRIMSWLFFSIFHALRRGVFLFYYSLLYVGAFFVVRSPIFNFSNKLKISQNVLSKSLWQSFENKNY